MSTILIVEDDIDLSETYVDMLEGAGHQVHTVGSSANALDYLLRDRKKPDLVLLDMNLPGESGIVVLGLIRRLPGLSRTKVVIVSGYPEMAMKAIQQWGADHFLCKPVSIEKLKSTVHSFLH